MDVGIRVLHVRHAVHVQNHDHLAQDVLVAQAMFDATVDGGRDARAVPDAVVVMEDARVVRVAVVVVVVAVAEALVLELVLVATDAPGDVAEWDVEESAVRLEAITGGKGSYFTFFVKSQKPHNKQNRKETNKNG